jgi:hypothetical protein
MTTYTSSATTDGWELIATSTNGLITYTIKEPNGSVIYNGPNPTGDIRKDSSLTRQNQELFEPFGISNFTGLSINGNRNAYVAANNTVNTLLSSLGQMVQQTNTDIQTQQTTAPVSSPAVLTTPTQADTPVTTPPTTTNPSLPISILDEESESLAVPVISEEELATLVDTELDISSEESGEEPNDILVRGDRYLDWRVKLSLAPNSNYLYNAEEPGILAPLKETGGVIFPYTPQINIIYTANYEASSIVHTNYKVHQYSNSAVDSITLTCDFTAQDTREAIYLLSVIHFFRSVTKMFYGQDQNPRAGTPPPLCYIKGMGAYQFAEHPIAITTFTYNLPQDVDYIEVSGSALTGLALPANPLSNLRLPPGVLPGGRPAPPRFTNSPVDQYLPVTRVPTKMQIQLSAIPVISRGDMAEGFSLEEYALGSIYTTGQFW